MPPTLPRRTWGKGRRRRWKTRWCWPGASATSPGRRAGVRDVRGAAPRARREDRGDGSAQWPAEGDHQPRRRLHPRPDAAAVHQARRLARLDVRLPSRMGWTSLRAAARSRERRDVVCPACLSLLGCPVCFALYAGIPLAEPEPPRASSGYTHLMLTPPTFASQQERGRAPATSTSGGRTSPRSSIVTA